MHPLLDIPCDEQALLRCVFGEPIQGEHYLLLDPDGKQGPDVLADVVQDASVRVEDDIVGDDAAHAGFEGGGAQHQVASQRSTHQRGVREPQVIQLGGHRLLPLVRERQARIFQRSTLARPFKQDDIKARIPEEEGHGDVLFHKAVETAEDHERILRPGWAKTIPRQGAAQTAIAVGDGELLCSVDTIARSGELNKALSCRLLLRIGGGHEELR